MQCKSVISVNRAAECIGKLALMPEPAHRIINLGFSQTSTLGEVCQAFSDQCGFEVSTCTFVVLSFSGICR